MGHDLIGIEVEDAVAVVRLTRAEKRYRQRSR
jgi:hypothetical protein